MSLLDGIDLLSRHAAHALWIGCRGDAAKEDRCPVCGAAELIASLVRALCPSVVGELMKELDLRAIGFETIAAHRELMILIAHAPLEAGVANCAINPVINAILQVAGLRMGVANAPGIHEHFTHIRVVVALSGLEEDQARWLGNDDAAVGKGDAGRQVQVVGENGELIGLAIAIRVFTDFDIVITLTVFGDSMRVVACLRHPQTTALIPSE